MTFSRVHRTFNRRSINITFEPRDVMNVPKCFYSGVDQLNDQSYEYNVKKNSRRNVLSPKYFFMLSKNQRIVIFYSTNVGTQIRAELQFFSFWLLQHGMVEPNSNFHTTQLINSISEIWSRYRVHAFAGVVLSRWIYSTLYSRCDRQWIQ